MPTEKESTNFVLVTKNLQNSLNFNGLYSKKGFRQRFTNTEVLTTLSSKGKISSLISIVGGFYQLKLCANANYKKDAYKFGYGISFGQIS